MKLETERLFLREMTSEDFQGLCGILQDPEVMYAYEHAFSDEESGIGWSASGTGTGRMGSACVP
ncbi:MAG: GNAT family N-acetyltransferase [Candidatus Merdivicinus sp.]